jgi:hypothetical protein
MRGGRIGGEAETPVGCFVQQGENAVLIRPKSVESLADLVGANVVREAKWIFGTR